MTFWIESLVVFIPTLCLIYMWKVNITIILQKLNRNKNPSEILIPTLPPSRLITFGCFLASFFPSNNCNKDQTVIFFITAITQQKQLLLMHCKFSNLIHYFIDRMIFRFDSLFFRSLFISIYYLCYYLFFFCHYSTVTCIYNAMLCMWLLISFSYSLSFVSLLLFLR